MFQHVVRIAMVMIAAICLTACGGGGSGGSTAPPPPPTDSGGGGGADGGGSDGGSSGGGTGGGDPAVDVGAIQITANLGLAGGAAGLVDGNIGINGVSLVGVSGTSLAVGVSGTGLSIGTIQGFSSVIVNDEVIGTSSAEFEIEGEDGALTDLRQGQLIVVIGDLQLNEAAAVLYRANVIGPLSAVTIRDGELGLGKAMVLAQRVLFNAATVYDGTSLAQLAVDQVVEISGLVDATGTITASYVRSLSVPAGSYKLVGEALNATDEQFLINGLTVRYDDSLLDAFEDADLEEGDVVEVSIAAGTVAGTTVDATRVELLPRLLVSEASELEEEGIVEDFVSAEMFEVQSQPVTTDDDTEFENGDQDDLENGVRVVVVGTIDAEGVLVAVEVIFEPDDSVLVEGVLEGVDLVEETLTVLSTTFEVRDLTDFATAEGLDDLQVGDRVEVVGYVDDDDAVAAEVEVVDAGDSDALLRGLVTGVDAAAGSFFVFNVEVRPGTGLTEFADFDGNTITAGEFFALVDEGDFVEVLWEDFSATSVAPDSVSLEDD